MRDCKHAWAPSSTGYFESSDAESCWFIVRIFCKKCDVSEQHVVPAIGEGELEVAA